MHRASLTLVFCLFAMSMSLGQQPVDTLVDESPEALPLIDLSTETELVRNEIDLTLERLMSDNMLQKIEDEYQTAIDEFSEAKKDYERFRSVTPNKLKLNNYIRKWRGLGDARTRWRNQLNDLLQKAEIAKNTLNDELAVWQLTRESAVTERVAPNVLLSIDSTITRLNRAIAEVNDQRSLALETSILVAEQKSEIDDIVASLEDWSSSGQLNVFYRRHPPIWKTDFVLFDPSGRKKLASPGDHAGAINAYYRNFGSKANIYLFLVVLLIGLIYYLRNRLQHTEIRSDDHSMQRVRDIVDKYTIATCVYFASVLALFYLGDLPNLIGQIFFLLVLASSIVLLRPFTLPGFKWLIGFIIFTYVMDTVKSYIWFTSAGYRMYMYFEAVICLGILWQFAYRTGQLKQIKREGINRMLVIFARLLVLVFLASILSNTLGYTNLSDTLLRIGIVGPAITVLAIGIIYVLGGVIGTCVSIYFAEHEDLDASAGNAIRQRTQKIVGWLAALIWIVFILLSAELYRPLFSWLELWLTEPWVIGEFEMTPGNLVSFILVVVVSFIIIRTVDQLIDGGVLNALGIPSGTLGIISMIVRYLIVALAVAVALGSLGIDLTKFGLIAGALGVGIGFGLQGIVANFIAGMMLTFEQFAVPGDTIEINGKMGVVQKIGARASLLRSFDGADIVVPNATLLTNDIINWTRVDDQKRLELHIGVAYGNDPNVVCQLLLDVVNAHPKVLDKPNPAALFTGFGDSSLDFRLLYWAPIGEFLDISSEIATQVYDELSRNNIQIPFPRTDVTILDPTANSRPDKQTETQ